MIKNSDWFLEEMGEKLFVVLIIDCTSEKQDVWFGAVLHVVNPARRLCDSKVSPLFLGHQAILR